MELKEVMSKLESMGTAQNRKIYRRHGAKDPLYGVSYANLNKLKKRIKCDHQLALGLWGSGNTDAMTLAMMVADPARFDEQLLESWLADLDYYSHVDAFVDHVASKTSFAIDKASEWTASKQEWYGAAGYDLVGILAMEGNELPDEFFQTHLDAIRTELHDRPNRTRHSMNMALIAIGGRNDRLRKEAEAAAKAIGKVVVDHGQTSCKTPEAIPYIERMWARKKR